MKLTSKIVKQNTNIEIIQSDSMNELKEYKIKYEKCMKENTRLSDELTKVLKELDHKNEQNLDIDNIHITITNCDGIKTILTMNSNDTIQDAKNNIMEMEGISSSTIQLFNMDDDDEQLPLYNKLQLDSLLNNNNNTLRLSLIKITLNNKDVLLKIHEVNTGMDVNWGEQLEDLEKWDCLTIHPDDKEEAVKQRRIVKEGKHN